MHLEPTIGQAATAPDPPPTTSHSNLLTGGYRGPHPAIERFGDLMDVTGAHLPLHRRAALPYEGGAVVGAVVNEQGIRKRKVVCGEPWPKEPHRVFALQPADFA